MCVSCWLKRVGGIRDGLLVAATLVYILGYAVWSINALVRHLGLLPLIDPQYFVAGIAPAIILALAYLAYRRLAGFVHFLSSKIGSDAAGSMLVLRRAIVIFYWMAMAGFLVTLIYWQRLVPTIVVCVLWLAIGLFYAASEEQTSRLQKLNARFMTLLFAFGPASLLISFYIASHRNLPQEVGGFRPRCGYVDLSKSAISNETMRDLIPPDAIKTESQILRTAKLSIYFSNSELMLVKPYVQPQQGGELGSEVYEIEKKIINAVHWCG